MPKNKKKYTNNFEEVEKLFNYLDNAKLFQKGKKGTSGELPERQR